MDVMTAITKHLATTRELIQRIEDTPTIASAEKGLAVVMLQYQCQQLRDTIHMLVTGRLKALPAKHDIT